MLGANALMHVSMRRLVGKMGGLFEAGPREALDRVARHIYHSLGASHLDFPLLPEDVCDSRVLDLALPESALKRGTPLRVGWVMVPPGLGSGGHTTVFRMVEALEAAGHTCIIFLYDRYGGSSPGHELLMRTGWPRVKAEVRDARAGIDGVDACLATSWQSAHVLAARAVAPMRRLYFVQDYEPFFYPRGSEYALAVDSYRFGFRNVGLGNMVTSVVRRRVGVDIDYVPFGCDTDTYRCLRHDNSSGSRSGVVFYAKPGADRRGFELAVLGLQSFKKSYPDQAVHVYGDSNLRLGFPVVEHGRLSPENLNLLYNASVAGLALSFTNISLVAEEMLAAGTIPIVNDSEFARADLSNRFVQWASPTPSGIADALAAAVVAETGGGRALTVAESVRGRSWAPTQKAIVGLIEAEAYGTVFSGENGVLGSDELWDCD